MTQRRRTPGAGQAAGRRSLTTRSLALALIAVAALAGCDPALPQSVTPPSATTVLTADPSWRLPKVNGECPTSGVTPTFSQAIWDSWLSALPQAAGTPSPTVAPITNTRIDFPPGCYYVSTGVQLDRYHPLQDVVFNGLNGGQAGAEIVQLDDPRIDQYGGGPAILKFDNVWGNEGGMNTKRITIDGFIVTGSKPSGAPYQANSSPGIAIGQGLSDFTLSNSIVRHIWGDTVYIARVTRAHIFNNNLFDAGRSIITQTGGTDVEVDHNVLQHTAGVLYNIETNSGALSVDRAYIHNNYGAYSQDQSTGTANSNGILWNVNASPGTTVSNVTFANNTSDSALVMWAMATTTSATLPSGQLSHILFDNNTTTSGTGGFRSYTGTDVVFRNNRMLGIVTSTQFDPAHGWTFNPPAISIGTIPSTVCGAASGNTFVNSAGVTTPMPLNLYTNTGYGPIAQFPACA